MTQCPSLGVLAYASPDVKTSPPRTIARMCFAALRWAGGELLRCLRLVILGCGYAVLGASFIVRLVLSAVAMTLLFLGGLRWETIKSRTMAVANWVDVKTLRAVEFLRPSRLSRPLWASRIAQP